MSKNLTSKISSLRTSHRLGLSLILALGFVPMLLTQQAYARATQATQASQYTITASAGSKGSISPSGSVAVNGGSSQTFTVTANSGYHIADVVVDSVHLGPQASPYSYTFSNVTSVHTISTIFGRVVNVDSLSGLVSAFPDQVAGDEIVIAPGTYNLDDTYGLIVTVNNMLIHGSTGNRDDVIILGDKMSSSAVVMQIFGFTPGAYGQYTTIMDMTIGQVGWSAIQMNGDESADYSWFTNLHIINCYEQFIKGAVVTTETT